MKKFVEELGDVIKGKVLSEDDDVEIVADPLAEANRLLDEEDEDQTLSESDGSSTAVQKGNMQVVAKLIQKNNYRIDASSKHNLKMLEGYWGDVTENNEVKVALKVGEKAMNDIQKAFKRWKKAWDKVEKDVSMLGEDEE